MCVFIYTDVCYSICFIRSQSYVFSIICSQFQQWDLFKLWILQYNTLLLAHKTQFLCLHCSSWYWCHCSKIANDNAVDKDALLITNFGLWICFYSSDCKLVEDRVPIGCIHGLQIWECMMTSSNGNIFCVTGPLCGEFTGHRLIPRRKASDAELWCFLWSVSE